MASAPRIGVVLGAGGPVGHAFHCGVLTALADAGWDPRSADLIVGTSIGAVTGGFLRAGLAPEDLLARVLGKPLSLEATAIVDAAGGWPAVIDDLSAQLGVAGEEGAVGGNRTAPSRDLLAAIARHPTRFRFGMVLAAFATPGSVSMAPVVDIFNRLLGPDWPAARLWICSVDAATGERVVFGRPGSPHLDVGVAVAASSAVPAIFGSVKEGGRRYVDGGLHSPANTDLLSADCGLDAVVVSFPMGIGAWPGRGGVDLPGRWSNHREAKRGLVDLRRSGVPVMVFEPGRRELEVMHYDSFDLSHRPEIAVRARESARRTITRFARFWA
ncbi:MAG TPA: patatin-like phospholipase family protein [Acidimicrobiales bacterium]|nr:patatin-like phospholipase family protein [Acidimicrobiales bacterium]